MSFKEFITSVGELFQSSFLLMDAGGNTVNILIILTGAAMLMWWIAQMVKFNKEAKENGGLE